MTHDHDEGRLAPECAYKDGYIRGRHEKEAMVTVDDQDLYTIVITTYIPPRQVGDGPWTPWYADYYHPAV